jgi:hypothetical protein
LIATVAAKVHGPSHLSLAADVHSQVGVVVVTVIIITVPVRPPRHCQGEFNRSNGRMVISRRAVRSSEGAIMSLGVCAGGIALLLALLARWSG